MTVVCLTDKSEESVSLVLKDKGQTDPFSQVSSKLMGHHLSSGHFLAKKGSGNKQIHILSNNSMNPLSPQDSLLLSSQREGTLSGKCISKGNRTIKVRGKTPIVVSPCPSLSLLFIQDDKRNSLWTWGDPCLRI
ncbi:hypothetical protein KIL84_018211 [Mauremys mutica]|uniref:Uncharacterized protein n=1 Tax=Mauremys mutica TaxID=74926 RepID=A0A9D3XT88_9SAUR|nr:hypothetical protein KIL84_018211 [Mauremys mutica]